MALVGAAAGRVVAGEEDEDEPVPPQKASAPSPSRPPLALASARPPPASPAPAELPDDPAASPAVYSHPAPAKSAATPVPFRLLPEQRADDGEALSDAQKRLVAHNAALRKELAVRLAATYAALGRELGPSAVALTGTLHAATELPAVLRASAASIAQAAAILQTLDSAPLMRLGRAPS